MASDDVGKAIGVVLVIGLVILAVLTAIAVILVAGFFIGTGVGFANYCKAFHANVRLERPAIS